MLRRCRSDVIRFANSDVLRRWRKVMWCVPYSRAKRTSQGEAVITHEVRITFRLRNTSFQKRKSSPMDCFRFWLRGRDLNHMTFGLWARRATKLLHPAIYWCRWPDLNRYGNFFPTDFKSVASADSATSACFKPNYYSIGFFVCQYLFKKSWKNISVILYFCF